MTSGRHSFLRTLLPKSTLNISVTVIEELREKLHQLTAEKERVEFQLSSRYVFIRFSLFASR